MGQFWISTTKNAVDVDVNAPIIIIFSEDMDPTTINQTNIRINDGIQDIDGSATCQDANATFTPTMSLECSTTYTVSVLNGVEDLFGNSLSENYSWSFTTITAGVCGCGIEVIDSDGDGVEDCNDGCPDDPNKVEPGAKGCGKSEDGDGGGGCFIDALKFIFFF